MKTPRVLEDLRNSENPIMNTLGLVSGLGCLVLGAVNKDPLSIGIGATTTPFMRYIIRNQAENATTINFSPAHQE